MKNRVSDLAFFGGPPEFSGPLHVGRPNIGNRSSLLVRIDDILNRRWLTNQGVYVQRLELELASFLGVRHCIPICNGTIALEIAARALDLSGEVIVPSFTFIATAHALQWQGITPVFADIDVHTHNIDPSSVEKMITPETTGIVGVHLWGRPCAIGVLSEIARKYRLKLLFDASHAFACSYGGQPIGAFGDAEIFSFHATKFFHTGEGGAIATNDDDLARKIRLMKNFGFSGYDRVVTPGTNGKMSELSAALGLSGLECLDDFIERNRANYLEYQRELESVPGVSLIRYDPEEKHNYQYIVLTIDETKSRIGRDRLVTLLHAENVLARRYFYPGCHAMEPYRSTLHPTAAPLPNTETLAQEVLTLPTGTAVGPLRIQRICHLLRCMIDWAPKINEAWGHRTMDPHL